MSPTLAKIIEDTEHTLNVAVPYAALELMKVVSELLASNLTELTNSLVCFEIYRIIVIFRQLLIYFALRCYV